MKIDDEIDESGRYRYWMRVEVERGLFDPPRRVRRYLLLNPSTASADAGLDPTTQRLLDFAMRDGYHVYELANTYGLRATDPDELWKIEDPVGPKNDHWITALVDGAHKEGEPLVVAWGTNLRRERLRQLRKILICDLVCFGTNVDGSPTHPLYLNRFTKLVPWTWP